MKLVRTAAGDDADDTAAGLAEFGGQRIGLHLELFDRIHHRHDADLVVNRHGVRAAVQKDLIAVNRTAVEADLREVLVVHFGKPVRAFEARLHAWNQLDQIEDVTAIERQVLNAFAFDGRAEAGSFSLDARNLGRDGDGI